MQANIISLPALWMEINLPKYRAIPFDNRIFRLITVELQNVMDEGYQY